MNEATIAAIDAALRSGLNDCAVVRSVGTSRTTVRRRRRELGLKPFAQGVGHIFTRSPITDEQAAAIDAAILVGQYDKVIARALDVTIYHVRKRRALLGVPFFKPGDNGGGQTLPTQRREPKPRVRTRGTASKSKTKVSSAPIDNPAYRCALYARVAKAIGHRMPADIRDDAISDIVLLVLSGQLSEDQIERDARKLSNKTLGRWSTRFGPKSLDEGRGDDRADDFNLYHLIASPEQAEMMRLAELTALAEKMGIDVAKVLGGEPELCEQWAGKRASKPRRTYTPYSRHADEREPEYPLVGELRRPGYGTGKWSGHSIEEDRRRYG